VHRIFRSSGADGDLIRLDVEDRYRGGTDRAGGPYDDPRSGSRKVGRVAPAEHHPPQRRSPATPVWNGTRQRCEPTPSSTASIAAVVGEMTQRSEH
jgi:hypothetical protein